jgi:hypothetical protein
MVLDNRWLALVQDIDIKRVVPLFILDHTGVRAFVPETGAARLAVVRLPSSAKAS